MLPCQFINVSLVSFVTINHPPQESSPDPIHKDGPAASARVYYLDKDGEESYIEIGFLRVLHVKAYGEGAPMPCICRDTRVILQWSYPAAPTVVERTSHQVLREALYPVILQRSDWTKPITRLWAQLYPRRSVPGSLRHEADDNPLMQAASVSDGTSSHRSFSCPSSPQTTVDDDWSSVCDEPEGPNGRRIWFELVDSESQGETLLKSDTEYYWDWSDEHEKFIHRNENGYIIPLVLE